MLVYQVYSHAGLNNESQLSQAKPTIWTGQLQPDSAQSATTPLPPHPASTQGTPAAHLAYIIHSVGCFDLCQITHSWTLKQPETQQLQVNVESSHILKDIRGRYGLDSKRHKSVRTVQNCATAFSHKIQLNSCGLLLQLLLLLSMLF